MCWRGPQQPGPGLSVRSVLEQRRRVLTLQRLTCVETEDMLGRDEIRLEVWLDGQFDDSLRFGLNDGQHKNLAATYEFNDSARVLLYDEDTSKPSGVVRLDRDDLLGSQSFAAVETASRRFTGDGADYTLAATVRDGSPGPATDAYDLLADFEASTLAGRWARLDKATIIAQTRQRLREPWEVNQGPTNTCGPAAVVVELARRSPRRYVRLVQSLFERGKFRLKNGDMVTTSSGLRSAPARSVTDGTRTRTVPDADWLVLASLRESANALFSGPDSFDTGGSTHWEVAGWLWNLCGYNRIDYFPGVPGMVGNVLTPWDTSAQRWLDEAVDVLGKDGCVVASLDTSILGRNIPDWWSLPNHLVLVLDSRHSRLPGCGGVPDNLGPLGISRKSFVEWSIATWSDLDRESTAIRDFESGMWMFITGY